VAVWSWPPYIHLLLLLLLLVVEVLPSCNSVRFVHVDLRLLLLAVNLASC
jgi:hypothetical protein